MNINRKVSSGILAILFIFACCQGFIMHTIISSSGKREIERMHRDEMEKARQKLRNYVEIAYSIIESNYANTQSIEWLQKEYGLALNKIVDIAESLVAEHRALVKKGVMTTDDAKKSVLNAIGQLRYNSQTGYIWNKGMGQTASTILTQKAPSSTGEETIDERAMGYVWVNDMQKPFPRMLMHPTIPELNGRILDDEKFNCALGQKKNLFVAMVEVTEKHGEGYIDYLWPKPTRNGLEEEKPKLSYVRSIPEWNWIIGTGIYVDDTLGKAIEKSKQDLNKLRYDHGQGYFWIHDRTTPFPVMVMHPTMPDLQNQVMDDDRFLVALGGQKHLFKAFLEAARQKEGGFVTYMWPKPARELTGMEEQKLSFLRAFEPFDWVIGTGVYIDSIDTLISEKVNTIKATNYYLLLTILSAAVALFLLLTTASYILIDRFFIRKINQANDDLQLEIEHRKITAEKLMVARRQAESANMAKSAFLANMSHEIRTPMNAVLGFAHLLQLTRLNETQQDYLHRLSMSADNLLCIIDDILDFSKIEAGKLELEEVTFNLYNDILLNVSQVIGLAAEEKGLDLEIDCEPDLPLQLKGDPVRLRQILINLLNNAVKFTPQGSVTLGISVEEIGRNNVLMGFEVHDTGIGMTEEEQGRLFTAFNQADISITRNFGGTGLGLSISKNLTERMGGKIRVKSQPEQGSTFHFTARLGLVEKEDEPDVTEPAQRHWDLVPPPENIWGARVLLVEDNPINQDVAREILTKAGMCVVVAGNGAKGIEKLRQAVDSNHGFDVVLMDIQMPVMDGFAATRKIRSYPSLRDIPVIAMTANAMAGDRQKALDAGMNDHVAKPILIPTLFRVLNRWVKVPKERRTRPTDITAYAARDRDRTVLPDIAGLTATSALKYMGGNVSLYRRLLAQFLEKYDNYADKMSAALAREDYREVGHLAHTLKGAAGILGAEELLRTTADLEEVLQGHDQERIKPAVERCLQELNNLLNELLKLRPDQLS